MSDNKAAQATTKTTLSSSLLSASAVLPGVGAALLPAVSCPACWPAYAGLLSSVGVGFIDYTQWLMPLVIIFLLITLAALFWQCYQRSSYGPFVLGILGTAVLVAGKFLPAYSYVIYAGAAVLVAASIWNVWPRKVCQANIAEGVKVKASR